MIGALANSRIKSRLEETMESLNRTFENFNKTYERVMGKGSSSPSYPKINPEEQEEEVVLEQQQEKTEAHKRKNHATRRSPSGTIIIRRCLSHIYQYHR